MFEPKEPYLDKTVLSHTKKRRNVIHGAKALMKQLPPEFQRPTRDWDLFSKKPKDHAFELQGLLDKASGGDNFYDSSIPLEDSNQVVYRVISRFDNREVADFMKMSSKIKGLYKVIGGVRYETLNHAKQVYKEILNNPNLRHRHRKALGDLERIEAFERSLKKGEPIRDVPNPFAMFQIKMKPFGSW